MSLHGANLVNADDGCGSPKIGSASRLNAIKHGLTAKTPVLPGEDPEALQAKIDRYKTGYETRDEVEHDLAEMAAMAFWQAKRANRLQVTKVTRDIVTRPQADTLRAALDVVGLGKRLLFDRRGPEALYPSGDEYENGQPRTSSSKEAEDPHDPEKIVLQLEATRDGRRWLLKRFGELREPLENESESGWISCQKFRCVRLLGKQPLDAIHDKEVALVFLASHALSPNYGDAFHELRCEIHENQEENTMAELARAELEAITPADAATGRAALLAIVDKAIERLRRLEAEHGEVADFVDEIDTDMPSDQGMKSVEQLQRHMGSCNRLMLRNLDTIDRRHRYEAEGWGTTRKERESRKDKVRRTKASMYSLLVLDEHGTVREAVDYDGNVEEGLARYKAKHGRQLYEHMLAERQGEHCDAEHRNEGREGHADEGFVVRGVRNLDVVGLVADDSLLLMGKEEKANIQNETDPASVMVDRGERGSPNLVGADGRSGRAEEGDAFGAPGSERTEEEDGGGEEETFGHGDGGVRDPRRTEGVAERQGEHCDAEHRNEGREGHADEGFVVRGVRNLDVVGLVADDSLLLMGKEEKANIQNETDPASVIVDGGQGVGPDEAGADGRSGRAEGGDAFGAPGSERTEEEDGGGEEETFGHGDGGVRDPRRTEGAAERQAEHCDAEHRNEGREGHADEGFVVRGKRDLDVVGLVADDSLLLTGKEEKANIQNETDPASVMADRGERGSPNLVGADGRSGRAEEGDAFGAPGSERTEEEDGGGEEETFGHGENVVGADGRSGRAEGGDAFGAPGSERTEEEDGGGEEETFGHGDGGVRDPRRTEGAAERQAEHCDAEHRNEGREGHADEGFVVRGKRDLDVVGLVADDSLLLTGKEEKANIQNETDPASVMADRGERGSPNLVGADGRSGRAEEGDAFGAPGSERTEEEDGGGEEETFGHGDGGVRDPRRTEGAAERQGEHCDAVHRNEGREGHADEGFVVRGVRDLDVVGLVADESLSLTGKEEKTNIQNETDPASVIVDRGQGGGPDEAGAEGRSGRAEGGDAFGAPGSERTEEEDGGGEEETFGHGENVVGADGRSGRAEGGDAFGAPGSERTEEEDGGGEEETFGHGDGGVRDPRRTEGAAERQAEHCDAVHRNEGREGHADEGFVVRGKRDLDVVGLVAGDSLLLMGKEQKANIQNETDPASMMADRGERGSPNVVGADGRSGREEGGDAFGAPGSERTEEEDGGGEEETFGHGDGGVRDPRRTEGAAERQGENCGQGAPQVVRSGAGREQVVASENQPEWRRVQTERRRREWMRRRAAKEGGGREHASPGEQRVTNGGAAPAEAGTAMESQDARGP